MLIFGPSSGFGVKIRFALAYSDYGPRSNSGRDTGFRKKSDFWSTNASAASLSGSAWVPKTNFGLKSENWAKLCPNGSEPDRGTRAAGLPTGRGWVEEGRERAGEGDTAGPLQLGQGVHSRPAQSWPGPT